MDYLKTTQWITDMRQGIRDAEGKIDATRLQRCYDDLMEIDDSLFTSPTFRLANTGLVLSSPRYMVKGKNKDIDVSTIMLSSSNARAITSKAEENQARDYIRRVNAIIGGKGHRQALYRLIKEWEPTYVWIAFTPLEPTTRGNIDTFLQSPEKYKLKIENAIVPTPPTDWQRRRKQDLKVDYNRVTMGKWTQDTAFKFAISKGWLYQMGFYLGLHQSAMQALLKREGYSFDKSALMLDDIVKNCFKIGFDYGMTFALLTIKGLEGGLQSKRGNHPEPKVSTFTIKLF